MESIFKIKMNRREKIYFKMCTCFYRLIDTVIAVSMFIRASSS